MSFVMTEKKNMDAIFEIFDFEKKSVLCDLIDETYIIGLLKRGANLYFREAEQKHLEKLNIFEDSHNVIIKSDGDIFSNRINYLKENQSVRMDFSLSDASDLAKLESNKLILTDQHLVLVKGICQKIISLRKKIMIYDKSIKLVYSIVPSSNRVKLVIPENLSLSIERYWSFRNRNPFLVLHLIFEWIFIRVNFLRKLFSDKLIIIK